MTGDATIARAVENAQRVVTCTGRRRHRGSAAHPCHQGYGGAGELSVFIDYLSKTALTEPNFKSSQVREGKALNSSFLPQLRRTPHPSWSLMRSLRLVRLVSIIGTMLL
jgi:hypothetical protein